MQQEIEILLVKRPLVSALQEDAGLEIADVRLPLISESPSNPKIKETVMHFHDWDEFGRKGSFSRLFSSFGSTLLDFGASSIWNMMALMLGLVVGFFALCAVCIIGWEAWAPGQGDYEKAQKVKGRGGGKGRGDEERRVGFKSAEELGLVGRGRVVGIGVGKDD